CSAYNLLLFTTRRSADLSLRERKDNFRLACQVKVKQDMKIRIPEEVFGVKKFEATVISNHNVATFIKEFVVKLPEGVNLDFEPRSEEHTSELQSRENLVC